MWFEGMQDIYEVYQVSENPIELVEDWQGFGCKEKIVKSTRKLRTEKYRDFLSNHFTKKNIDSYQKGVNSFFSLLILIYLLFSANSTLVDLIVCFSIFFVNSIVNINREVIFGKFLEWRMTVESSSIALNTAKHNKMLKRKVAKKIQEYIPTMSLLDIEKFCHSPSVEEKDKVIELLNSKYKEERKVGEWFKTYMDCCRVESALESCVKGEKGIELRSYIFKNNLL